MKSNIAQAHERIVDREVIDASAEYDDFSKLRGAVVEDVLEIEKALYLSALSDQQIKDITETQGSFFDDILATPPWQELSPF